MYPAALQAKQDPGASLQQHLLTQRKLTAHRASQYTTTQNGNTNSTATVAAPRESIAGSNNVATVVTEAELMMSHHIEYSQKQAQMKKQHHNSQDLDHLITPTELTNDFQNNY